MRKQKLLSIILMSMCILCASIFPVRYVLAAMTNNPINPNPDIMDDPGGGGVSWSWNVDQETLPETWSRFSGEGTETNPYLIYNSEDLDNFKIKVYNSSQTVYGIIMSDFHYGSYGDITNLQDSSHTYYEYRSFVLDGNYKRIKLDIDASSSYEYGYAVGLFGWIGSCSIKNLKVTGKINLNGYIEGVGALVGGVCHSAVIDNCYVSADINFTAGYDPDRSSYVGGFIGSGAGINENYSGATIAITNSAYVGNMRVFPASLSKIKCDGFVTSGSAPKLNGLSSTENSYAYYYRYVKGESSSGMQSDATMNSLTKSFDEAYNSYLSGENYFVKGKWSEGSQSLKYYYSGAPNISWLLNRNKIKTGRVNAYAIEKGYETDQTTIYENILVLNDTSVSANEKEIEYNLFGEEYNHLISYTPKHSNFIFREYQTTSSGNQINLTIYYDIKISVNILTPVDENGNSVEGYYTINDTGSCSDNFPDLITYSQTLTKYYGGAVYSYAKLTLGGTRNYEITVDRKYVLVGFKFVNSVRNLSTLGGNFGNSTYRKLIDIENQSITLQPILKMKTYTATFN